MSFKSREKKRRMKVADAQRRTVIDNHRRSDETRARHFLTPVQRSCCCNRCGISLRVGRDDCVYRHTPREILCIDCANVEQIPYRSSSKWEAKDRKRRPPTPAPESRR